MRRGGNQAKSRPLTTFNNILRATSLAAGGNKATSHGPARGKAPSGVDERPVSHFVTKAKRELIN